MAQIFHSGMNTVAKASIVAGAILFGALAAAGSAIYKSAYVTEVTVPRDQPVPFSHEHHVRGIGIDCRYCHSTVEQTAFAGLPPTHTCMTCHSQIWNESPTLEPVRESYRTGRPLRWTRVHDLPDFVYFDHSIHVNKGVGCVTCHGQVDRMPLTWQEKTLYMEWCLECHRQPERFVRPREFVFSADWQPLPDQLWRGTRLVKEYDIKKMTDCSVCHR